MLTCTKYIYNQYNIKDVLFFQDCKLASCWRKVDPAYTCTRFCFFLYQGDHFIHNHSSPGINRQTALMITEALVTEFFLWGARNIRDGWFLYCITQAFEIKNLVYVHCPPFKRPSVDAQYEPNWQRKSKNVQNKKSLLKVY